MKIQYSKPDRQDIPAILELFQSMKNEPHRSTFSDVNNGDQILNWLNQEDYNLYVARTDKKIIGVLRAYQEPDLQRHACLLTIAVSTAYRKQGIGKSLIIYGVADLKNKGILVARALIFSDNKPSINTFLSAGFSITGSILKHHFNHQSGHYVDDLILYKELTHY